VKFFFDNNLAEAAERAERGSAFIVSVNGKVDKLG